MKGMERVNWLETRKYRRASGVITHRKYIEYKVCMRVNNTQTHTHTHTQYLVRSRNTAVGIGTRYGLEGPGIKSRLARDFYASLE